VKISNHDNALLEHPNEFLHSLIFGCTLAEALEKLNNRDLYPGNDARGEMKRGQGSGDHGAGPGSFAVPDRDDLFLFVMNDNDEFVETVARYKGVAQN
jgi:hypothetical protein